MTRSAYGERGGTSKNAGKTATTYEATFPDGRVVRKRSFEVSADSAFIGAYQHEGVWYAIGVFETLDDVPESRFGGRTALPARRLS